MSAIPHKFRLVTRSDFDGLVCAVLLRHLELIDDILFVHPKDMQDGKIVITARDITTNLPYVAGAHLVFDHHLSETIRHTGRRENHIIHPEAPSAARVVYDHYGGARTFPAAWNTMMAAVDKGDSARFTREEVLDPQGWDLLNFLMDARTGLGRFHDFRISNYQLMMDLIGHCATQDIEQLMALPDVVERSNLYREHSERCKEQIRRCAKVEGNLVVLDLRGESVRVRHRQVDPQPQLEDEHRRADAGIRRGRARERRHLPGGQRSGRGSARRARQAHHQRRVMTFKPCAAAAPANAVPRRPTAAR